MGKVYGTIYKITNILDGKNYIGKTTVGFRRRYHNNLEKYTHNKHLKHAIKQYGIECFDINICIDNAYSEECLNEKEKFWILFYKSKEPNGYNLTNGGDEVKGLSKERHGMYGVRRFGKENPFYNKTHTIYTKRILSDFAKTRIGQSNPNYGNGSKISGENNPMYGVTPKKRMDENTYIKWKDNISKSTSGANNPNSKKIINLTTGEIFEYIKDAIKIYGEVAISACCRGKCKTAAKCKWMYYSEYIKLLTSPLIIN